SHRAFTGLFSQDNADRLGGLCRAHVSFWPTIIHRSSIASSDSSPTNSMWSGRSAPDRRRSAQPPCWLPRWSSSTSRWRGWAAARLGESARPPRIVFLTVHDDQAFIDAARDAGAQAYVIKNHIGTDLMPAIRGVLEGRSQFPQPAVQSSGARVRG